MKKIILASLFISTVSFSLAQFSPACLNLSANLARGAESANVMALQGFLVAKSLLKATPNGYFGPATLAAVKAFQKSVGLSQVGNTGPATRAAIKKDSCSATNQVQVQNQNAVPANSTSAQAPSPIQITYPRPILNSIDLVTLFAGGETDWGFSIYGQNFSSTTNLVYFRHMESRRAYAIGTFASATGTVIVLPKNITNTAFSCGTACSEKLPVGAYEVMVETVGGQTDGKTLNIKAFTISAQTGAVQQALAAKATNVKVGSLSFSSSQAVIVRSVIFNTVSSSISASGIGNLVLKDEISGNIFAANTTLFEFQSVIISAYGTTANTIPGTVTASFTVEIEDYIGKKRTKFTSPSFLVTVAGIL